MESNNPVLRLFGGAQGPPPVVGLPSRLASGVGGVGADRVLFQEFCTRVGRNCSREDTRALYALSARHGKVCNMYAALNFQSAITFSSEVYNSQSWRRSCGKAECRGIASPRLESAHTLLPTSSRGSSRVVCKAVKEKAKFSRDQLTDDQLATWEKASAILVGAGFEAADADQMLGKAYGWTHSPYWTEKQEKTVPDSDTISSRVELLKSFGFSDAEVAPVLKKFPEVLGIRESLVEHNLEVLDKTWFISGKMLKKVLNRNPHVLGYNTDCRGDCEAKCTRCWARF